MLVSFSPVTTSSPPALSLTCDFTLVSERTPVLTCVWTTRFLSRVLLFFRTWWGRLSCLVQTFSTKGPRFMGWDFGMFFFYVLNLFVCRLYPVGSGVSRPRAFLKPFFRRFFFFFLFPSGDVLRVLFFFPPLCIQFLPNPPEIVFSLDLPPDFWSPGRANCFGLGSWNRHACCFPCFFLSGFGRPFSVNAPFCTQLHELDPPRPIFAQFSS